MMNKILGFLLMACTFIACKPEAVKIEYHKDECAYCAMKISDPKFGAELVTDKSKVYKFDSAECLFDYMADENPDIGLILVTDFFNPHTLIDANKAMYLISENVPSPMGANLSAYASVEEVNSMQQKNGGEVYEFQDLFKQYKNKE